MPWLIGPWTWGSGPEAPVVEAPPAPDPLIAQLEAERQDSQNRQWRKTNIVSVVSWEAGAHAPMAYERIETAVASTWSAVVVPLATQWSRVT